MERRAPAFRGLGSRLFEISLTPLRTVFYGGQVDFATRVFGLFVDNGVETLDFSGKKNLQKSTFWG